MGNRLSVSVIITVYNTERYVREAIESVFNQTILPAEIIVVDDGSTDQTAEISKSYEPKISYIFQDNAGPGPARNTGLKNTSGNLIAFLDGDDIWDMKKIEKQKKIFEENPEIDMVFTKMKNFHSPELKPEEIIKAWGPMDEMVGHIPSSVMVKRTSFFHVGWFSSHFKIGEWVEWYAKSKEKGLNEYIIQEVLVHRRLHTSNIGIRERRSQNDYLRIVRETLKRRKKLSKK